MKFAFRLFVSANAPGCDQARRNLERICERIGVEACQVEVVDIRLEPKRAEEERILALPTLVKYEPAPALRVIGDLSDQERILRAIGWIQPACVSELAPP
jgi:circadian clock protein KaiB